jgi:hypothetical protein
MLASIVSREDVMESVADLGITSAYLRGIDSNNHPYGSRTARADDSCHELV